MAEFLHFSRDSRMYLVQNNRAWTVPVLDGFSFSQATNASEITLNEMEDASGRSRRGRKMFTDSLSAAEFSFSTYMRPFKAAGGTAYNSGVGRADSTANNHHAVEEVLWVAMGSQNVYDAAAYKWKHGANGGAITSFVTTSGGTDAGRSAGTYTVAVPGTNVTIGSNGSNTPGSATFTITVNGSGVATSVITDRGIGFNTGATVTIAPAAIGGGTTSLVLTVTSEAYTSDTTDLDINFFDSNRSSLSTFDVYFVLSDRSAGRLVYKLSNAVINEASVDFEIDGIATINWSGFAGQITDITSASGFTAQDSAPSASAANEIWIDTNDSDSFYVSSGTGTSNWHHTIDEGTTTTDNFIRNRLTQLSLAPDATFKSNNTSVTYETNYAVAITAGNITINNNITFLTPEELGRVNQPIEHVTGTRTVTGSFTCYLGSSDAATNKSKNLFEDLVQDVTTVINEFELKFDVGGSASTPRLEFAIDRCHLEIPSHSIDDVISLETNFHGLGSNIGESDEITLKYVGK
jgi:hypothetical protein